MRTRWPSRTRLAAAALFAATAATGGCAGGGLTMPPGAPATGTSQPVATPSPTATLTPTSTPEPVPTHEPTPTPEPEPTETPTAPPPPRPQPPAPPQGNIVTGRTLYLTYGCRNCHDQGLPTTLGPAIRGTRLGYADVQSQVRRPRDKMPPFSASILSDADLLDIYAYLRSGQ